MTSTGGLHNFSMSWAPKLGAKTYRFEVSTTPAQNADGSFAAPIEYFNTDTTSAAPTMQYDYTTYQNGGALYWHVAAVDADGNQGAFSATQTLTLPLKLTMSIATRRAPAQDGRERDRDHDQCGRERHLGRHRQGGRRRDQGRSRSRPARRAR